MLRKAKEGQMETDYESLSPEKQAECDAILAGTLEAPGDGDMLCIADDSSFYWGSLPAGMRICTCNGREHLEFI